MKGTTGEKGKGNRRKTTKRLVLRGRSKKGRLLNYITNYDKIHYNWAFYTVLQETEKVYTGQNRKKAAKRGNRPQKEGPEPGFGAKRGK